MKDAKLVHAFQEARKVLVESEGLGWTKFICNALWYLQSKGDITSYTMRRARNLITRRLRGAETLEIWLYDKGLEPFNHPDKVHAARLAWLDSLIKEFS